MPRTCDGLPQTGRRARRKPARWQAWPRIERKACLVIFSLLIYHAESDSNTGNPSFNLLKRQSSGQHPRSTKPGALLIAIEPPMFAAFVRFGVFTNSYRGPCIRCSTQMAHALSNPELQAPDTCPKTCTKTGTLRFTASSLLEY